MMLSLPWMTSLLVSLWIICPPPVTTSPAAVINASVSLALEDRFTLTKEIVKDVPDINGKLSRLTRAAGANTEPKIGHLPDNSTTEDQHDDTMEEEHGIELFPVETGHVEDPLIFTLVVILAALSKLIYHFSHFLSSKVPESCVLIIIGVIFGIILYFSGLSDSIKLYEPHQFFLYLLPPIILEAAFSLHDRTFAENLGSVLIFAVLGTVLNCFIIGFSLYGLYQAGVMEEINCSLVQILVFSALIVAVDPVAVLVIFQEVGVNSTLYYLVFGESLLNDGVTVVLYNVMQIFNNTTDEITAGQIFMGVVKFSIVVVFGVLTGAACGLLSSFITKFTNSVKVVEPLIVFGFAYLSFLISEIFEFSGIISIIACGIIQAHYAFNNVTNKSRLAIKFLAKVMSTANEIIIFMFLGLVTVSDNHDWKTGFTLWTTFLCVVTRFLVTFSSSMIINACSSDVRKIKLDEMFMISYGGLRGAVCFSLVALIKEDEIPMKNMFVTTTLFVVFFTVFVQGGTIKWLVKKLRVDRAEDKETMSLNEELGSQVFDHIMAGVEEILGYKHGTHHIKMRLDQIDSNVFRPVLLRQDSTPEISNYYEKLVMKEHYKNLRLGDAKLRRVNTSIRTLDSELALDKLDTENFEHSGHRRPQRLASMDNGRMSRRGSIGDSLHKFFSTTLHTVRSQLHLQIDDRDIDHDKKHNLAAFLRKKHRKNKQLSEMRKKKSKKTPRPSSTANLAELNHELKLEGFNVERRTSQVHFDIGGDNIGYDDDESGASNGTSDGKVEFRL